jgi:hypothetical protein
MNGPEMRVEKGWGPAGPPTEAHRPPWRRALSTGAFGAALLSALACASVVACGANMQAVYEGDMRFEHCMALDAEPDVTPMIQRACWIEWLAFYTYGQTRDRVRHAEGRIRGLANAGVVPIEEVAQATPEPLAAPAPASMVSSPPLIGAVDGGTAEAAPPPPPAPATERQPCLVECAAVRDECRGQCTDRSCERGCSAGFAGCTRRCPP